MLAGIAEVFPSIVWTALSGTLLTIGDVVLRLWFGKDVPYGFGIAFLLYAIGLLCMMMSFFGKNIAIATVAAVIINVVTYLLFSYIFYGDTLGVWKIIGIGLGLISIAILEGM